MRPIEVGDTIVLLFNNPFFWIDPNPAISSRRVDLTCEVLHTPQDTGDMWYMRDMQTGKVFALNPSSCNLNMIILQKKK